MKKLRPEEINNKYSCDLPKTKVELSIVTRSDKNLILRIKLDYKHVYGLGERFDAIDQKGRKVKNEVIEKFCEQGSMTYCSIPFFFTDSGFGILVNTYKVTEFEFFDAIDCHIPYDADLYLFEGSPKEIISDYLLSFGEVPLPPRQTFGPWISANHWSSEADIIRVMDELEKYDFPATVLVIEAWSDEATFYIWNGAKYTPRTNGCFSYEDFDLSESPWPDPKAMIERLGEKGISVILWQIPVYKDEKNAQSEIDRQEAIRRRLCVSNSDGSPYLIPEGNWFSGNIIPDFTNDKTISDWFAKRQYLLDIGVAGFKTDGGEFIYSEETAFSNGDSGREQKNGYAQTYINAYKRNIGEGKILFSRAGYIGAPYTPILWAGDHKSTFGELRACYNAAISAACSGIIFWSFDIGGFAGELPTAELYLRATQFACFCPIMQWHSEPDGGQFADIMAGAEGNNERSPWNIAAQSGDPALLDEIRIYHKLRMELMSYIYDEAAYCVENGMPMMSPLFFYSDSDPNAEGITDEYCFGRALLVAPILDEGVQSRELYLPNGEWVGFFSGKVYEGGRKISSENETYPVFIDTKSGFNRSCTVYAG